jgi:alpha-glucosidase
MAGGDEAIITVAVLEAGIVRVAARRAGRASLDRSWAVCGRPGDTPLEGRRRDDYSAFSCPAFAVEAKEGLVRVRTACLDIEIGLDPFRILWRDSSGAFLAADQASGGLAFEPQRPDGSQGLAVAHLMEKRRARFYGFGEKSGKLNKDGRRLVMMNIDSLGYGARKQDPLYKHVPFYVSLDGEGRHAYGLFYDNFATSEFDLGRRDRGLVSWTADSGELDYYFIYGPAMRDVVKGFALLAGRPCLPPRWSLGYGGSTMGYTDAPDAQVRLERFLDLCDEEGFPCDLFHLSSGYTTGKDGKRYVFEWNRDKVPDAAGLFKRYAEHDVHVSANVKPALLTSHPRYAELDAMGAFVKAPGGKSFVAPFWGGQGSWIDFTNPRARDWWKARMKESLLGLGVDSSWNDNNEFEAWDEGCTVDRFGEPGSIDQMRPLLTYHMVRTSREAQLEASPGKRPFVITRSASAGIQRYAQTWTGDNYASWSTLKYNIPMGSGLSLSGLSSFGHDAGGFTGFRVSPELFVRWVQCAALNPRFCIHSWHFDGSVNEPWMYPGAVQAVKDAFSLRYRLLPYLYSLFAQAAASGEPELRPLVYEFPEDEKAAESSFEFLLGPSLLVAPVYRPGARKRKLALPAGADWLDLASGERHEGGTTVNLDAPLESIPILARGGAIIPMGKAMRRAGGRPDDFRELALFPSAGSATSAFTLYEDDGESLAFERGARLELTIALISSAAGIEIALEAVGPYRPDYRSLDLVLPPGETRPLSYRGKALPTKAEASGRRRATIELSL